MTNHKQEYVYKLKKHNNLSPHSEKLVKLVLKGNTAISVNFSVDGIPTSEGLYFGAVDMNGRTVCGEVGKNKEEVLKAMIKWVDENFELVKVE